MFPLTLGVKPVNWLSERTTRTRDLEEFMVIREGRLHSANAKFLRSGVY